MTSEMKHDFVKEIIAKKEEQKSEEPSNSFKVGFVLGSALVIAGSVCLEALFFMAMLSILGFPLTFLKCLAIAATVEFISFKLKN